VNTKRGEKPTKKPNQQNQQSMAAMVSSSLRVFQSSGNGVTGAGLASSKSAGITGGRSVMVPVSSAPRVGAHVGLISLRASKVEVEEEETRVVTGGGGVGVVTTRRLALALVAGVMSSLNSRVAPANAAYGEAGTCVRGVFCLPAA
jgi:hypothetical protein